MRRNALWFVPAWTVVIGIFMLSTFLSVPIQIEGVSYMDKWQHMFAYFVLTLSFLVALIKTDRLNRKSILFTVVGAGVYGVLMELTQYTFFSHRYFEWMDATANVLGTFLGLLVVFIFNLRKDG